jgi:hypothetical protein
MSSGYHVVHLRLLHVSRAMDVSRTMVQTGFMVDVLPATVDHAEISTSGIASLTRHR